MTREEAIKELSCIADEMPSMECANWIEAISMAIKALEQEPCDDAISRQAAIDAFNAFADESNQDTDIHEAIEIVLNLPSVTPAEDVTDTDVGEMPYEDAISRAELVRKLNAWDCKVNGIPNYVWKVIRELPSVTPAENIQFHGLVFKKTNKTVGEHLKEGKI